MILGMIHLLTHWIMWGVYGIYEIHFDNCDFRRHIWCVFPMPYFGEGFYGSIFGLISGIVGYKSSKNGIAIAYTRIMIVYILVREQYRRFFNIF